IGPTGLISFPLAGQIKAGGMTPTALEEALKAKLKDKYTTDLDITVTLVASKVEQAKQEQRTEEDLKPRIYVTGEVLRPGPYVIRMPLTVLQAIAVSGGFGLYAAKRRVQVRRQIAGQEVMFLFNFEDFHSGRNIEDNIN